jgi:chromosome segregation ATPase
VATAADQGFPLYGDASPADYDVLIRELVSLRGFNQRGRASVTALRQELAQLNEQAIEQGRALQHELVTTKAELDVARRDLVTTKAFAQSAHDEMDEIQIRCNRFEGAILQLQNAQQRAADAVDSARGEAAALVVENASLRRQIREAEELQGGPGGLGNFDELAALALAAGFPVDGHMSGSDDSDHAEGASLF